MLVRSLLSGILLMLICLGFSGCSPTRESQADEQKNPYFIGGKERSESRDYKGAIAAFEKALESNPRSVLAHYELATLYDSHSDQKEEDYVAALYHYNQVIKLRPNDYPADNARERIAYCKRELVKTEALAPVAQSLIHDLAKLKAENSALRKQLDSCQFQIATHSSSPVRRQPGSNDHSMPPAAPPRSTNVLTSVSRAGIVPPAREWVTPLPPVGSTGKTHTVKERETFFSIARQYHLKPEMLMLANPNLDPKRLKVGQVINLPST